MDGGTLQRPYLSRRAFVGLLTRRPPVERRLEIYIYVVGLSLVIQWRRFNGPAMARAVSSARARPHPAGEPTQRA